MKKSISMRIDLELYNKVKRLSELHNRSFSNFVETALKEHLEKK